MVSVGVCFEGGQTRSSRRDRAGHLLTPARGGGCKLLVVSSSSIQRLAGVVQDEWPACGKRVTLLPDEKVLLAHINATTFLSFFPRQLQSNAFSEELRTSTVTALARASASSVSASTGRCSANRSIRPSTARHSLARRRSNSPSLASAASNAQVKFTKLKCKMQMGIMLH